MSARSRLRCAWRRSPKALASSGTRRKPSYSVSAYTVSAQLGCGPCAGGGLSSLGCVPSDRGVARVFLSALRRRALIEALPMVAVLDHLHRVIFGSVYEQCPDQSAYCGYPKYFERGMRYSHCSESGNDLLDSVGGIGPTVLERACDSVESDRFRSNEFVHWRDPINTRVWRPQSSTQVHRRPPLRSLGVTTSRVGSVGSILGESAASRVRTQSRTDPSEPTRTSRCRQE